MADTDQRKGVHFFLSSVKALNWIQLFFDAERPKDPNILLFVFLEVIGYC